ncbi:MAG: alpha/beta hydrolase-fold protein [Planctomycetota bacterium]
MKRFYLAAVFLGIWLGRLSPAMGQEEDGDKIVFQKKEYRSADGKTLPYRLVQPMDYDPQQRYPLLLFLHGAGECGTDNEGQLTYGREFFIKAAIKHRSFVVAPQCPENVDKWTGMDEQSEPYRMAEQPNWPIRLARELIESLTKQYPIDKDRIYVMGISMGGFGAWEMLCRYPDLFAAGVPICGGGDESKAGLLGSIAIRAFHGARDQTVPVERSRNMIKAIQQSGGKPEYTEYPDEDHECWNKALADPALPEWLYRQKRQ